LGVLLLGFLHVLLEQRLDAFRRQGADAAPVLDSLRLEDDAGVSVFHLRVIRAELLDDAAVARLPRVDRDDAKELPVLPAHLFHANTYGHGATLPRTDNVLLDCLTNGIGPCPRGHSRKTSNYLRLPFFSCFRFFLRSSARS